MHDGLSSIKKTKAPKNLEPTTTTKNNNNLISTVRCDYNNSTNYILQVMTSFYIYYLAIASIVASNECSAFHPSGIFLSRNNGPRIFFSALHASRRSGAMSRKKKMDGESKNKSGSGFGSATTTQSTKDTPTSTPGDNQPGVIYSRPALYDLAFGYRNYEEEVKFLLDSHEEFSLNDSTKTQQNIGAKILELAAGPARHSITSLRQYSKKVASCTAVDISTDMMEYSNEVADEELGDPGCGGLRDNFHYINGDMRQLNDIIQLQQNSFDSAWILLGSMQHLTTNDDVIACFKSTYDLLRPGGTMVIELPHPRETFTMVECTRNGWEVPLEDDSGEEYGELKIIWGDDDDHFDPIRQVRDFTVVLDLNVDASSEEGNDMSDLQSVREVVPMRLFTFQEIDALSRVSGFEVMKLFGALSDEIDVNSDDEAFRLVCVLRKEC